MIDILAQAADPIALDQFTDILAQGHNLPGNDTGSQAPPGMDGIFDRIIGAAKWLGLVICIIAVIVAGAAAAISRQRGSSEEATTQTITIAIAIAVITGAVGIVSWIVDASGEEGEPEPDAAPPAVVQLEDQAPDAGALQTTL